MAISLVAVGAKITAAITNAIINVVNAQGLTSVIPTSVAGTGVSVGASGKVTITAASPISVNGCFTTTYENYLIVLNAPTSSTANNLTFRLRAAGVDDTSANYDQQATNSAAAVISASQSLAGTSFGLEAVSAAIHDISFNLFAPNLAAPTRGDSIARTTANPATAAATAMATRQFLFRNSTQFDGFTLTANTGNITGTIRIYGYNNN